MARGSRSDTPCAKTTAARRLRHLPARGDTAGGGRPGGRRRHVPEQVGKTLERRCSLLATLNSVLAETGRLSNTHTERLSGLAKAFAAAAGLPPQDERDLELLAVAHDVGKVGVLDYVFLKPGPLTGEERSLMEKYCEIGHRIAKGAAELESIAQFILHHHERWDGHGYPDGLGVFGLPAAGHHRRL